MIVPFALETPPYPCPHGKMLPMHILTSHDASKCESFIISFQEMVNFAISSPGRSDAAAEAAVLSEMSAGIGRGVVHSKRSEEHTSELQSLMRISYAVFCLKKKIQASGND